MSRLAAVANGLFYPTSLRNTVGIAQLINVGMLDDDDKGHNQILRVLDPCAGRGSAGYLFSSILANKLKWGVVPTEETQKVGNRVEYYTIELDAHRAAFAERISSFHIKGNSLSAWIGDETMDVLFHNPPYDNNAEEKRTEHLFLKKFTPKLRPGGLLVHIVPQNRIAISADYLSINYSDIQVYRFAEPEHSVFNQVVLLARKNKEVRYGTGQHQKIQEFAESGILPVVPTAAPLDQQGVSNLSKLVKFYRVPETEEVEEEILENKNITANYEVPVFSAKRKPFELTTRYEIVTAGGKSTWEANSIYAVRSDKYSVTPISFTSGEYNREDALKEVQKRGCWTNKTLANGVLPVPYKKQKYVPLTPMRQGQLALLVGVGMVNNLILTDEQGKRAVVKGHTYKEFITVEEKVNEDGVKVSTREKEIIKTSVTLIELDTGEITEIKPAEMGALIKRFRESIRNLMVSEYPPVYIPKTNPEHQENPIIRKLEIGSKSKKILRVPLGGQQVAITAAAVALRWYNTGWLAAQQGSGKSYMGGVAAYLSGARSVVLVCPSHLVQKWVREIKTTVPNSHAEIVGTGSATHGKQSVVEQMRHALKRIETRIATENQNLTAEQLKEDYGDTRVTSTNFVIISMQMIGEEGKWRSAVVWRCISSKYDTDAVYPHCPRCGAQVLNKDGKFVTEKELAEKKFTCTNMVAKKKYNSKFKMWIPGVCGEQLWQPNIITEGHSNIVASDEALSTKRYYNKEAAIIRYKDSVRREKRKYNLAKYISRRYRQAFDLCILDEVHKFKGANTARGLASGIFAECSKSVLAMTGTLAGGKASNMFPLFWRFSKAIREEFGYKEQQSFIENYGVVERITFHKDAKEEIVESGAASLRRTTKDKVKIVEKAGMSPRTILFTLQNTMFLKLLDVSNDLPPYKETVELIEMDAVLAEKYYELEHRMKEVVKDALVKGSQRFLGIMINSLLKWVDQPQYDEVIYDPRGKKEIFRITGIKTEHTYAKERKLLELIQHERKLGRKVLVYISDTQKRDIVPRLKKLLEGNGLRVKNLPSSVAASKREEWIFERVKETDVLLVNPKLVETGLDLLDFPTICFYQVEFSTYVMMQAARRSWRLGQKQNVRVIHFVYEGGYQKRAVQLMAAKVKAAQMLLGELDESEFTELASDEANELAYSIARELIAGKQEGENLGDIEHIFQQVLKDEVAENQFMCDDYEVIEAGVVKEEPAEQEQIIVPVEEPKKFFYHFDLTKESIKDPPPIKFPTTKPKQQKPRVKNHDKRVVEIEPEEQPVKQVVIVEQVKVKEPKPAKARKPRPPKPVKELTDEQKLHKQLTELMRAKREAKKAKERFYKELDNTVTEQVTEILETISPTAEPEPLRQIIKNNLLLEQAKKEGKRQVQLALF